MKICSTCGATYSDRIDFCFEDGAVLAVGDANSLVAPAPVAQPEPSAPAESREGSVPSMDAFDAPLPPPRLVRPAEDDAPQAGQAAPEPAAQAAAADEPPVRKRRSLLGPTPAPAESRSAAPLATITPPPEEAHVEYEEEVPTPEPRSAPKGPDPNRPLSPSQDGSNDPDWIEPTGSDPASAPAAPAAGPSRPASSAAELARASSSRANSIPPASPGSSSEERKRPAWMLPVAVIGAIIVIGGVGFFAVAALGLGGAALTTASQEPAEPAPVRPTVVPVPTAPGAEQADVEPVADTDVAAIVDSDAPALEVDPEGEATAAPPTKAAPAAPAAATPAPTASSGGSGSVVGAAASPAPAAQIGKVSFDSSPAGATVVVDGVSKGRTPTTVELPYGEHAVSIELSGHAPVAKTVAVGAAEVSVPKVTLEAEIKVGKVFVALPGRDGQTLYVDGRKVGPLPQSLDLTEGSHAFAVEAPDGTRVEVNRDVVFTDGRAFINL